MTLIVARFLVFCWSELCRVGIGGLTWKVSYNKSMFDELDEGFKKTMSTWYEVNIKPVFEQARQAIVIELEETGKLDIEFGYWWASYIKNSVIFFELMMIDKYSNQSSFSMRLLMEISADALFMSEYPENISESREQYLAKLDAFKMKSYVAFSQMAEGFRLYEYDNGVRGKCARTIDRIKRTFGKDGLCFYKYLCCYTHLNYVGIIKDIDISIEKKGELDYRLQFTKYYSESFTAMVRAAEKLSGENDLFSKIDVGKIKTAIFNLATRHSLGELNKI